MSGGVKYLVVINYITVGYDYFYEVMVHDIWKIKTR